MGILGILCVTGSFAIGIQSAGDMKAIAPLQAGTETAGDMNDNGRIDQEDVTIILEIVKGYRTPTPLQLRRDPSGDGRLDLDDAMRLLRDVASL